MGYYTEYDISGNSKEVIEAIIQESDYSWYCDAMEGTWYNNLEDCLTVSKKFPDQLIIVEGDGEDQGDQWKAYYKNGKHQKCKAVITFEPFDEAKLK